MRHLIAALCMGLGFSGGGAARAYDLALIIGNEDYERLPEFQAGDNVDTLDERLRRAGFEVIAVTNVELDEMLGAVDRFVERAPGADRLFVLLNGHFLSTGRDIYLLPVEARETLLLTQLPRRTLSTSILRAVLSDKRDERAVMVLGSDTRRGDLGPYVTRGLGDLSDDYDFALIAGAAEVAEEFARNVLAVPGESFGVEEVQGRNLALHGLDDPPMTFIPEGRTLIDVSDERTEADGAVQADRDYWRVIRTFDTEQAYVNYLDRFPDGAYAEEAGERLDAIRNEPDRQARQGEDDLNLGRDERRRVQTSLSALDFDPGAIDGIFGPGTRTALSAWQRANGFVATGYLTADQLSLMSQQAGRRVAELEAEAERLDRTYWAQTGADGGEAGLRAYLERYPRGNLRRGGAGAAGCVRGPDAPERGAARRAGLGRGAGARRPGRLPAIPRPPSHRRLRGRRPGADRVPGRSVAERGAGCGGAGRRGGLEPEPRHPRAGRGTPAGGRLRARRGGRPLRRGHAGGHPPLPAESRPSGHRLPQPGGRGAAPRGFAPALGPAGEASGPVAVGPGPRGPRRVTPPGAAEPGRAWRLSPGGPCSGAGTC